MRQLVIVFRLEGCDSNLSCESRILYLVDFPSFHQGMGVCSLLFNGWLFATLACTNHFGNTSVTSQNGTLNSTLAIRAKTVMSGPQV